jgi:hypothetical protein
MDHSERMTLSAKKESIDNVAIPSDEAAGCCCCCNSDDGETFSACRVFIWSIGVDEAKILLHITIEADRAF